MVHDNADYRLVTAINADDWNEIARLAEVLDLYNLRLIASVCSDKIDAECVLEHVFGDGEGGEDQSKANDFKHKRWLRSQGSRIDNEYMSSFVQAMASESSDSERAIQAAQFESLSSKFPDRYETYVSLMFILSGDASKRSKYLSKIQSLAPNTEVFFLLSATLNPKQDNAELSLQYCDEGHCLNGNNLFLFYKAGRLEYLGRSKEAADCYQRIVDDEPEGSYLSERAAGELNSGCYIATVVYGDKYSTKVEELRIFRDAHLNSALGSFLIRLYYRSSPAITERIRGRTVLIEAIRLLLDSFIGILRWFAMTGGSHAKPVESKTPTPRSEENHRGVSGGRRIRLLRRR